MTIGVTFDHSRDNGLFPYLILYKVNVVSVGRPAEFYIRSIKHLIIYLFKDRHKHFYSCRDNRVWKIIHRFMKLGMIYSRSYTKETGLSNFRKLPKVLR